MGFFDKMSKAVGDVVDKGKREADQFMRIQKIKGEIAEVERKIAACTAEIVQVKSDAGAKAILMLRAGALSAVELQPLADRVVALEQQIEAEQAVIAGKRADIEKIKAEDDEPAAAVVPVAPAPVATAPVAPPPPVPEAPQAVPPPLPTDEQK
jgi:hypothetical protein